MACEWTDTRVAGSIDGYSVATFGGKSVGHVAGESSVALVVESGTWPRKRWRPLPKQFASVDEQKKCVLVQFSREMLVRSPKLKPVDDEAVASWWGLDSHQRAAGFACLRRSFAQRLCC